MNTQRSFFSTVVPIVTILCVSTIGSAQVLLSNVDYAILGGTAISIGGPGPNAIVNGNVGLSPGATSNITGFPPAVVSGLTLSGLPAAIISTGGATGQARADLITAQNALFAMPIVPANILSNLDLGTLAPLGAGVYTFGGAAIQTGAIVLDANFQNGVAWVFNIATSLTTAANSTITFTNLGTNGGSDLGLYWNAGTSINIGDNNTVLGNYLAGASISFTGITTTLGSGGVRALALAGVSFAGPGSLNPLGGPSGGDYDGGLVYDGLGQLVPIPPPVIPPVLFTGNVILSQNGAFTPGLSAVVLVPGTTYPTTTLTIDGVSANGSGPASLTINTATVTLTGANTYTGGTIINNGTLIANSFTLPTNQAVALNSSTLTLEQSTTGTFGGVISGSGGVVKSGAGVLTVTGANTYAGGTVVNGGTLVATTASLPANRGVVLNNNSTLVFDQSASTTFGGSVTGGGTIQKRGTGALTMANTTTSAVDVQAGSLFFNTGLGRTTVSAGALLGGSGTITGNLVNNGTVSPGTSPGTINVTGNFTQSATGSLLIEIASLSSFDRLAVSGSASLAGALQVNTLGGYNPIGQSFIFLTAPGGVTGTFGTFATNVTGSAATAVNVTYTPTSATVAFRQLPFAGFATTPNQGVIGTAAQGVPTLTTTLNGVPLPGQFPVVLNALSPQGYQVWSDIAFANSTSLADHLLRQNSAVGGHDRFYFEGGQRRGRSLADADVGSSRYTTNSGLVGGNGAVQGNTNLGAYFAYGKSTSGLGSVGSQTTVKEKTLGLRAGWADGPLFVEAMVAYGFNRYESTRSIVFPGTAAVATSSNKGHQWTTGITAGKHLNSGIVSLSPFAGLLWSRWSANGFTEQGAGAYNATVGSQSARSLRSQLGVEARVKFGILQPHIRAAWLHEFSNDSRGINAAFGNVNYAVATRRAPGDTGIFSAGVDVVISPNAVLYTAVTAESGGSTRVLNEWRAGFAVRF
ncbi:MAG: autotransporter domain-containing protein [Candidatus Didemnitutus sp.]|nr:autotransporter domain-containing protein [Candidatus Didemnitutus sp.]